MVVVDSTVVWSVPLVTGADGTLPICVVSTLLAEMDEMKIQLESLWQVDWWCFPPLRD